MRLDAALNAAAPGLGSKSALTPPATRRSACRHCYRATARDGSSRSSRFSSLASPWRVTPRVDAALARRPLGPAAQPVNATGHQLLAGAALAGHEDRERRLGDPPQAAAQTGHDVAPAQKSQIVRTVVTSHCCPSDI